uniref:G-protein coupled receptors family 1 profile domain-containing protein n=1 Tax=Plectus sambesii TaxID=2011161 RepID=A0A914XBL2_9BILA
MELRWYDIVLPKIGIALDVAMYLTLPVYIVILTILIKIRKDETFSSAFFSLMTSVGIADALKILTFAFGPKLASYGWIPQWFFLFGDNYSRWYNVFNQLFSYVQIVGALAIAFNRFTAYLLPFKHAQIWEGSRGRRLIWICIILQWLAGLAGSLPLLHPAVGFRTVWNFDSYDNRSVYLLWRDGWDDAYNRIVLYPIKIPIGMVIFILYLIIFGVALAKQTRGSAASTVSEVLALKMAVVGLLSTCGLFIYIVIVVISEKICLNSSIYFFFYNAGNNLFAAVHPYALLIFSKSFRERCNSMLFGKTKLFGGGTTSSSSAFGNFLLTTSRP